MYRDGRMGTPLVNDIHLQLVVSYLVSRDYILDLLEGGRKLIVFGHHKSVLDSISECLHNKVKLVVTCPSMYCSCMR